MKILIADDDNSLRKVLLFKLRQKGFDVFGVEDGQKALEEITKNKYDLLLSDIRMPKLDGIELLEKSKQVDPELKTILLTAHASVPQAVAAVKLGAFDYITKPFEDDILFITIEKALRINRLETENKELKGKLREHVNNNNLVGVSKPFKDILKLVEKIASTDATVLITGSSGTGKEGIAKMIHTHSNRSGNDLIVVNCAAIPKELIESELFGHVRGAFTGAIRDKKGKFELADGSSIFLDEIGEMPLELQAKLLRVIQERIIEPVGSESSKEIDVRIIAATNINLKEKIEQGKFREDLFYRLNVIPIEIPSLSERKEDISVLIQEFIRRFTKGEQITIAPQLQSRLLEYSWPGNVRELENLIERMVILRKSNQLTLGDLPSDFGMQIEKSKQTDTGTTKDDSYISFNDSEKKVITDALTKCGWNKSAASKYLKIPRHVLIYRMQKYDIKK